MKCCKKGDPVFAGADFEILLHLRQHIAAPNGGLARITSKRSLSWMSLMFSDSVLVRTMFGASMPCRIMFMIPIT